MAYYDLLKAERTRLTYTIHQAILNELPKPKISKTVSCFSDEDTYIRKAAYQAMGRIYHEHKNLQAAVIDKLKTLLVHDDYKVRQTTINAAGEIGKRNFKVVHYFFDQGLVDPHHSPRNAVIGSIKKMGEVNPVPVLTWAKKYLHHENKEIRRQICHGIELRGRKHPQDILPLLKELQHDKTARVRNTLVHVIGQISYKKGCLKTVIDHLKTWDNKTLVAEALEEIIDVHNRYKNFSALTQEEAREYIANSI
jgi:HEAT repeat protein